MFAAEIFGCEILILGCNVYRVKCTLIQIPRQVSHLPLIPSATLAWTIESYYTEFKMDIISKILCSCIGDCNDQQKTRHSTSDDE